jgi:PAS domain S-box-containing protein
MIAGVRQCIGGWVGTALVLTLVLVTAPTSASLGTTFAGNDYLVDSWETEQGLPENSATSIVQDPQGYLWFGTFDGLVRFDGTKFKVYSPANTPSLPSAGIVNLHQDASDRLWVSTLRGVVVSQPKRWTDFHPIKGWPGEPDGANDYVRTFSEHSGVLCLTTFGGRIFRTTNDTLEQLPIPQGVGSHGCLGHVDRQGQVWAAESNSDFFGHWNGSAWVPSPLTNKLYPGFLTMASLKDGRLLVVKTNQFFYLDAEEISLATRLEPPLPITNAWSANQDSAGNVWVSADGLFRITPSGQVTRYSEDSGLTYNSMRCTFEDREHNLWAGTSGGGLLRLKPFKFMTYGTAHGLTERNVKALLQLQTNTILIGTYGGGLFQWQDGQVTRLPEDQQPASKWVQSLLYDRQQRLWVGSYRGDGLLPGLTLFSDSTTLAAIVYPEDCKSVRALLEDSRGKIWIGGGRTVIVLGQNGFSRQQTAAGRDLPDVGCFADDPTGNALWAAADANLYRFSQGEWREVMGPEGKPLQGLFWVRCEADGAVWMAVSGRGLLRLKQGRWSAITEREGLPSDTICSVLDDGLGNWWLASNRGVIRARRAEIEKVTDGQTNRLPCEVFTKSDGLASVDHSRGNQNTSLRDSQGRLWFATQKGIAVVDPRNLERSQLNTNPPPVYFETLSYLNIQGERVELELERFAQAPGIPLSNSPSLLELPAGSSQLEVSCSVLSFVAPEKVKLQYRWERNNKTFLTGEKFDRKVASTFLPPGDYRLHVKAANNDGFWNDQGAILMFSVQPFYWQTVWFQGLLIAVFGGGVAFGVGALQRTRLRRAHEDLKQQQALAEERARSAALTQHATDLVTLLDGEGKIIYESPSATRILGHAPGHLLGRHPIEFVHPDDQARARAALEDAFQNTNLGSPTEFRGRHAQGHWVELEALATNLLDQAWVQGVLITARDITERKLAQRALVESEERFRELFEQSPDAVFVEDASGKVLDANPAACRLHGFPPEQLVGMNVLDLVPPEARESVRQGFPKWLAGEVTQTEGMTLAANGRRIPVEVRGAPIHYRNQPAVLLHVRDITERKQSEDRIRQQAALLAASHDAILVWDLLEGIQFMNPAAEEMTGKSLSQVRSRELPSVLPVRSGQVLQAALTEVTSNGSWTGELVFILGPGQRRDVASRWTLLKNNEGNRHSILITCNDITEKKKLEAQYLRAQRLESVGTLASGVAHDLNNILSPLVMGLELLSQKVGDASTGGILGVMRESARRGADTVKQLLTFARGAESQRGPMDLVLLLKEIGRLLQQTFPKNIQICTEYPKQPATVLADPSQMHQVLMNLCVNARDSMPDGGTLLLVLSRETLSETQAARHPKARPIPYVVLKVADTGTGIQPEVLDRIFIPFFTTKPQGQGTGLGLSTVLGIVENHGGFVRVESEVGQGSAFYVYLPVRDPAEALPSTASATRVPQGQGELILLVDDEPAILKLAAAAVRSGGYLSLTAESAAEAASLYGKNREQIRAVVTDIMMPQGDGRQLISLLHQQNPGLPIIAMSGLASSELLNDALKRGARALLQKPFTPGDLLDALAGTLRGETRTPGS